MKLSVCRIIPSILTAWLLSGCAFFVVSLSEQPQPLTETTIEGKGRDKILLVDISGMITDQESSSGLINPQTEPSLVVQVKEALKKAEGDSRVKAVLLRINSPGGTVTASDLIYHELIGFKERTKRPVIASILDLGTSGAYYIAQAADRIFAHPTAVTGSIGVIMVQANVAGLLDKIGVKTTEIKSGDKKFMGSPFRPMAPEEQAIFQNVITSMYQQFLTVVAKGRPALPQRELLTAADGRIYTAQQAKEFGLIDEIGYLPEAITAAKTAAKLDEAKVVTYHRGNDDKSTIYSMGNMGKGGIEINLGALAAFASPRFMYLWSP